MVTVKKRLDLVIDWVDGKNRNISLFSFLFSVLFIPFASVYTSPLNPYYGSDAAVFMLIGKGMTQGLVPYLDLYDHKGPLLFFFNALGYWLYDGKLGVLCVQIVFFAVALFLMYKIARLFLQAKGSFLALALFCYYYLAMVEGGNLSEEWSLAFSLLPLYLSLRFLLQGGKIANHPRWYSFVYGLCLGVQVYIRLNNASILCGIILAFIILLLVEKSYAALFANAGMVLAGVIIVSVPIVLYFTINNALIAFWKAAFIDNFVYAFAGAETKTWLDIATVLLRLLLYPVLLFVSYRLAKEKLLPMPVIILVVCVGSVSAPLLFLGYGYLHYFLVFAPVMVLTLCLVGKAFFNHVLCARRPLAALLAIFCIAVLPFAYQFTRQVGVNLAMDFFDYQEAEVASVAQIMQHIPEEEQDSIWAYDVKARFYLYADVLPCDTYFVSQSFHAQAAPDIAREIDEMLLTNAPQWIVLSTALENVASETLQTVLAEEYTLVEAAEYGLQLYLYQKVS